jgi:hypothetical protein
VNTCFYTYSSLFMYLFIHSFIHSLTRLSIYTDAIRSQPTKASLRNETTEELYILIWHCSEYLSRPALWPIQPLVQCVPGLPRGGGVKSGRGVTLTPHTLLVQWSRKSRTIPLLPLWAVRRVQSLSACTRVHFTLQ